MIIINDTKIKSFEENIKKLLEDIGKILIDKNKRYKNSFYEGLDEIKELYKKHEKDNKLFYHVYQLSFYVREKDKLNRLKHLISSDLSLVEKKIGIYDTVLDIVGYGILFLNYLKKEDKTHEKDQ